MTTPPDETPEQTPRSLRTKRLSLRPAAEADAAALAALLAEPEVAAFWPGFDEEQVRRDFVGSDEVTALVLDFDGAVAGLIQFDEGDDPMYRQAGIDLFVGQTFWGLGLGREAIEEVVRHLFVDRGHHRLTIDPAAHNTRAIHVYARVGFRRAGLLRQYERGPDGRFHDGVLMELLRDDWERARAPAPAAAGALGLRLAAPGDEGQLLPMMHAFNALEGIEVGAAPLRSALGELLARPDLGLVFVVERDGCWDGYAVVTWGYDLEFAGRDAFLTELYVTPEARRRGVAREALGRIEAHLRSLDVRALHLLVNPDNAAATRLYDGLGFEPSPRRMRTKRLG